MDIDYKLDGTQISLDDMLKAREYRVLIQNKMLQKARTTVSFTLNIPGPIKRFALSVKTFDEGKKEIEAQFKRNNIKIIDYFMIDENTGTEGFWAVDAKPLKVKELMICIDEFHPLGRIFDIDVIFDNGLKVERSTLGYKERTCLVCDNAVSYCARARTHSVKQLINAITNIMIGYFLNDFCDKIAEIAIKSLLYEVCITPKPGLVDRKNNGSHSDMDIFTFLNSSSALYSYFRDITLASFKLHSTPPEDLLFKLNYLGLMAEQKMYLATNEINTHKGVIYSAGILCAAFGYLYNFSNSVNVIDALNLCQKIVLGYSKTVLDRLNPESAITNGEKLYINHGIKGVRGEVSAGFPSVQNYSLPALKQKLELGWDINSAGLFALFTLMANIDDTNIISRSDIATMEKIRTEIKQFIQNQYISAEDVIKKAEQLDEKFISLNISAGGAADLLSITFMCLFMC